MAFRKVSAALATVVIAAGAGTVVGSGPAQAAVSQCSTALDGLYCEWTSTSYGGSFNAYWPQSDNECSNITRLWPRAVMNRTYKTIRWYANEWCTGSYATVARNAQVWNIGFAAHSYRNLP